MNSILSEIMVAGDHSDIIHGILFLVVVGIVLGIIIWLVGIAPFIPAIFKQIITWLCYGAGALILINFLLGIVGHPIFVLN